MYFIAIEAQLTTEQALSFSHSRFAHASILQLITQNNTDLGVRMHSNPADKRITIAVLPESKNKARLRITLFSEFAPQISDYLANHWERCRKIRFGSVSCEIESFQANAKFLQGVTTWDEFLSQPQLPYMRFSFLTPMAIMKTTKSGERYSELQPRARDIFQSLQRKWITFGGPVMDINILKKDNMLIDILSDCIPANIKTQSEELNMGNYKLLGVIGHIVYLYRGKDLALQKTLNALACFARFSGVGYHTMQGMGSVHTENYQEKHEASSS